MPLNGLAVASVAGGVIFVWSGVKGYSILKTGQNIVQGHPANAGQSTALLTSASGGGGGGVTNDSGLVAAAESIAPGLHYVFGGAPATGACDCSSFLNDAATKTGLPIPKFPAYNNGANHGPTTVQWRITPLLQTIPQNAAAPNDIVVWLTHVGIVTDNGTQMISALNPQDGIRNSPIKGFGPAGQPMVFRRWN